MKKGKIAPLYHHGQINCWILRHKKGYGKNEQGEIKTFNTKEEAQEYKYGKR